MNKKNVKALKTLALALIFGLSMLVMSCSDSEAVDKGGDSTLVVDPTVGYQIVSEDTISSEEMAEKIYNDALRELQAEAEANDDGGNSEDDFEAQALEVKNAYLKSSQKVCDSLEQATGANGMVMCHKTCTFTYQSIDAEGKPITLSAFVAVPQYWFFGRKMLDPNYVMLHCSDRIFMNNNCPTSNGGPSGYSHADAIVIAPDFIGYGLTKSMPHPMNYDLNARNALDALKAGFTIATKHWGVKMEEKWGTYIVGALEGAAIALATQKLMEQDSVYCDKMNLKYSYVYNGAFDLAHTVDTLLVDSVLEDKKIDYSDCYLVPYVIEGLIAGYPEIMKDYKTEDFFTDAFLETGALELMRAKETDSHYVYLAVLDSLGDRKNGNAPTYLQLSKILKAEVLDENSEKYKLLHQCLEKNVVYNGWTPTHKLKVDYNAYKPAYPIGNYNRLKSYLDGLKKKEGTDYQLSKKYLGLIRFYINLWDSSF